jgi:single-strand DNA-binding protein
MTNLNRITLLGNTGKEPKANSTANGKQVTRLSVATNKRFKDDSGEWISKVQWHSVVIYGSSADYAAKIEPGTLVFIEGEMSYRNYDREIEGVKVQWPVAEVIASSITAIQPKEKAEHGTAA